MVAAEYFLTEADAELTASSTRDPLGFEIIWTQLGGRVVPHFSTISTGATNFGVCLTLIWLVDSYLDETNAFVFTDGEQWREARDGLLIVAESLHAYSSIRVHDERTGILGSQKASRRLQNEGVPHIGPFDREALLVRQLAFGVYGRYRRALASMGMLDDSGHLEDPERVGSIIRDCPGLDGLEDAAYWYFDQVREAGGHCVSLDDFEGLEQMAALRQEQARRAFAPHLCGAAELTEDSQKLIAHVYRELDLPYRGAMHARDVFYRLADSGTLTGWQRERVLDICRCEELLLRFDALFDQLWNRRVDVEASQPLVDEIKNRRGDLTALAHRPALSSIAQERLRTLAEVAERQSPTAVVRALVRDYHRDTIADYRGNSEWVGFDGDRVVVINTGHSPSSEPLESPTWRRNYYLQSLASFKSQIEEVA